MPTFFKGNTHHLSPSSSILEQADPVTRLRCIVSQNHMLHAGCAKVYRSKQQTGHWISLKNGTAPLNLYTNTIYRGKLIKINVNIRD